MPFKSKKAKIRASARKIAISEEGLAVYRSRGNDDTSEAEIQKPQTAQEAVITQENYNYIPKEIIRILALASLIIGLQLILRLSNITF